MQILEFYHKDQKSPESIQRFEINTCLLGLSILNGEQTGEATNWEAYVAKAVRTAEKEALQAYR